MLPLDLLDPEHETFQFFERPINVYQSTRRNVQQDFNLNFCSLFADYIHLTHNAELLSACLISEVDQFLCVTINYSPLFCL
jgi:hypothetical protein